MPTWKCIKRACRECAIDWSGPASARHTEVRFRRRCDRLPNQQGRQVLKSRKTDVGLIRPLWNAGNASAKICCVNPFFPEGADAPIFEVPDPNKNNLQKHTQRVGTVSARPCRVCPLGNLASPEYIVETPTPQLRGHGSPGRSPGIYAGSAAWTVRPWEGTERARRARGSTPKRSIYARGSRPPGVKTWRPRNGPPARTYTFSRRSSLALRPGPWRHLFAK